MEGTDSYKGWLWYRQVSSDLGNMMMTCYSVSDIRGETCLYAQASSQGDESKYSWQNRTGETW